MNITLLLTLQLIADAVLCVAVVFLFAVVNREIRRRGAGIDPNALVEFNKLIAESQGAAESLLKAMDDSRRILKEISFAIDEKERRLKTLMEISEVRLSSLKGSDVADKTVPDEDRYEKALGMIGQGLTVHEVAERLGLTEGEINLLVELRRKKDESA
jgi:DNA-binding NarL/FixJ family response regulator